MRNQTVSISAIIAVMFAAASPASAAGASKLGISQAQAKREILGDGYTKVQNLHKAAKGWTATALEGGKPVTVMVDERGDVAKMK
jgi:acid phosphatase class B